MSEDYVIDPVDEIVVGALGEPGARVFMIQARSQTRTLTIILEKQQVMALGHSSYELLMTLGEQALASKFVSPSSIGEPGELIEDAPLWRAGEIAMGYENQTGQVVIICYEQEPDPGEISPEEDGRNRARFYVRLDQLAALGIQSLAVVSQGRPTCPICGLVIESEPHVCPSSNGHRAALVE